MKKLLIALLLLGYSSFIFAEKYEFEPPHSINAPCSGAVDCASYFEYGFIRLISIDNNSSKIQLFFTPSNIEEENETFVYILTLAYDAAVTNIYRDNVENIGAIPAQASDAEYQSKIPGAVVSYAENNLVNRLPSIVQNAVTYIKIATALLSPVPISRDPSVLNVLDENSILGKDLYPYHSFYQFFTRPASRMSTISFTINKSLNDLVRLIREKKMSVYIGGNRENEFLVEGLSELEYFSENGNESGNNTSWTTGEYNNNQDINQILSIQGAATLTVSVNGRTESGYDYVRIYDENDQLVNTLDGSINTTFTVQGSSIKARLTTDGSVTSSGVTVTVEEGGEVVPDVELTQNGHWISSGGRDPNTYRNIKYDFTLENSGSVSISLDATRSDDAYLYVLDSQGEVVLQDDDSGGDRDSLINNQSLSAGNYTIVVATYNVGKTGDFTLIVTGAVSGFHQNLP